MIPTPCHYPQRPSHRRGNGWGQILCNCEMVSHRSRLFMTNCNMQRSDTQFSASRSVCFLDVQQKFRIVRQRAFKLHRLEVGIKLPDEVLRTTPNIKVT